MRKRILPIAVIAALIVCILCFAGCGGDSETPSDTAATVEATQLFKNKEKTFDYGYIACYANPQNDENPDNPDNLYGIMDSQDKVIVKPEYESVYPIVKNKFVVRKRVDDFMQSALIDNKENFIIPFFIGEIRQTGVLAPEGTPPILVIEPSDGKVRFVNTDGEQIIPLEFDGASIHQYDGFFFGSKNTEAGETLYVYDYNGKEICVLNNGDYAELRELEHGYTLLIGNNNNWLKFGLKNSSGKVIIPCKYEEIKVVGADRIVAFDGELESLIETSNVANMFDGDGKQLTKDGEFARIFFDDGDKIGIGCQSATIGAYEPEFWLIDLNGKAESGKYDSIEKDADGNFVCKKGDQTETIKSVK